MGDKPTTVRMRELGLALRRAVYATGMDSKDLARRMGYSPSKVCNLFGGRSELPAWQACWASLGRSTMTTADPTSLTWRKSTFSNPNNCVELAWRKSSFSDPNECVELAWSGEAIVLRDSKDPASSTLLFERAQFAEFLARLSAE